MEIMATLRIILKDLHCSFPFMIYQLSVTIKLIFSKTDILSGDRFLRRIIKFCKQICQQKLESEIDPVP